MKRLILGIILLAFVTPIFAADVPAVTHPQKDVTDLQNISVTVKTPRSQGSGVMFTRDDTTFIWTAGHVAEGLRHARPLIDPSSGTLRTIVEFKDAQVVQEFTENGRRIGEMKFDARVVKYSDADHGEDLAILEIRKKNFTNLTTVFYLEETIPPIGTDLLHVGSLLGQFGSNSLTTGIVSQIGRTLELGNSDVIFDQTTVTAFPGSSGGGVFLKSDYRYMGMLVRGAGEQFNFIVPARRIKDWATKTNTLWAIDPSVALPDTAARAKIVVEDSGVVFTAADKAANSPKHKFFLLEIKPDPLSRLFK